MPSASTIVQELTDAPAQVEHEVKAYDQGGVPAVVTDIAKNSDVIVTTVEAAAKESKAGYRTTEFWLTIAITGLTVSGTLPGVPDSAKAYITAGLAVAYAISRGIAKHGVAPSSTSTMTQDVPA